MLELVLVDERVDLFDVGRAGAVFEREEGFGEVLEVVEEAGLVDAEREGEGQVLEEVQPGALAVTTRVRGTRTTCCGTRCLSGAAP